MLDPKTEGYVISDFNDAATIIARQLGKEILLSWTIYDATKSMAWPGCAKVSVTVVHFHRGMIGRPV
jgi:hypothetical protein